MPMTARRAACHASCCSRRLLVPIAPTFDGTALLAAAVNNYAVCCVFLKKIDVAMKKLENIMQDNPSQNMTDALVFNLCTIYDLSYSPEISANKKKMIQQIAGMYRVEEINWRSFRLA